MKIYLDNSGVNISELKKIFIHQANEKWMSHRKRDVQTLRHFNRSGTDHADEHS